MSAIWTIFKEFESDLRATKSLPFIKQGESSSDVRRKDTTRVAKGQLAVS